MPKDRKMNKFTPLIASMLFIGIGTVSFILKDYEASNFALLISLHMLMCYFILSRGQ